MANKSYRDSRTGDLDPAIKRLVDLGDGHHGEQICATLVGASGDELAGLTVTLDGEKVLIDEDSLPASLTETTVTVAQNESESGEVDLAGAATVMIYPPAAVEATTAQMSFKVGRVTGSRAQLNDEYGVKLVIPFTAGQPIRVPASMLPAVRFLSIVLETSGGVAVAQATAAREFVFVTRRV
jgi:hypothetical protein